MTTNLSRRHTFTNNISPDYQIAESLKLELDYSDETSDYRKTNFPARHLYERVLPKIVADLSDIYYHRGSPYSGHGRVTTDRTFGDIHQCTLPDWYFDHDFEFKHLQGTCGTDLKSHGIIGTYCPGALFQSLACKYAMTFPS
jgi:hypothetical protein